MLPNRFPQRFALPIVVAAGALLLAGSIGPLSVVRAQSTGAADTSGQEKSAQEKPQKYEWLKDDEGRAYRVEPMPKSQGLKIDEKSVRTMWGVQAELIREDDQNFYIKIYRVDNLPAPRTPSTSGAGTSRNAGSRAGARGATAGGAAASKGTPAAGAAAAASVPEEPLPKLAQRLQWTPFSTGLPQSGQWRENVALVDINNDGRLDIVPAPARKTLRPPSVFLNDGNGSWTRSKDFTYPERFYDYGGIAAGDLNRDGKVDLVLAEHLRGLIALRGGEGGTFADSSKGLPFAERADAAAFSSRAVVLTDCNGDGRLDIVALGEGPRLTTGNAAAGADANIATGIGTFIQQEDGSWTPKMQTERAGMFGASMTLADIDGDGKPDLVTAPGVLADTRLVHYGDGACGWKAETVDAVRPRAYITAIAAGDVDGDGRPEIVAGYTQFLSDQPLFGVDVLSRGADGKWTAHPLWREPGRVRVTAIGTGDLDGDGKIDVAAVSDQGVLNVFLGDGKGGFTRERQSPAAPGGCSGSSLTIADLDRDGLGDLVIGYSQESDAAGVCPGQGALTAWKARRAAGTPSTTGAAGSPRRR